MLLSFEIQNFRSFRESQELSLVADKRYDDHRGHLRPVPAHEEQVLPVAALYGANGAGKSNFIKALSFLKDTVAREQVRKSGTGRQAFSLDEASRGDATALTLQFMVGGRVFAYGLRVDDAHIREEWLSQVAKGKETIIFERITDKDGRVKVEWGNFSTDADREKLAALATIGVKPNQAFLNAVVTGPVQEEAGDVLNAVKEWFRLLVIITPDMTFSSLIDWILKDADFVKFVGGFLDSVGTGVRELVVTTEHYNGQLTEEAQKLVEELPAGESTILEDRNGIQLLITKGKDTLLQVRRVKARHLAENGNPEDLPLLEESDGTQRLIDLLPVLHAGKEKGWVWVIDEIDRSLHPLLAKRFVREFLQGDRSRGSQLLFTTHDTSFLDTGLLRRDEIWFAEKEDASGATKLYSLADYKVRSDLRIDKRYLEGRFGAVPPLDVELPGWVRDIKRELAGEPASEEAAKS